jgi:hypothetical protein
MKKSSFSEIERHAPSHALQRTAPHVTELGSLGDEAGSLI